MKLDFDAAIFDMDGTLLDTMPYWRYTSLEYLLAHQMPVSQEALLRMYDTSSRRLLPEYAATLGIVLKKEDIIPELEAFMGRHYRYDASLKTPSVPVFLDALQAAGVRMCVCTGSRAAFAREGLERLGLLRYFDFVTDNYEGPYTKNQPAYFEWALLRLGATAERCWVFEDALYAMRSAKACGIRVCAIEEGTQRADWEQIQGLADRCIRDYAELLPLTQ